MPILFKLSYIHDIFFTKNCTVTRLPMFLMSLHPARNFVGSVNHKGSAVDLFLSYTNNNL